MKVIFFNKKDDDDGVIVRIWMGPGAPTLANLQHSTNLSINLHISHDFK